MKRPQPDLEKVMLASFINNIRSLKRFKKHWGTTNVQGTTVLKSRHYYYPASARPSNFEELFRFLGAYNDVVGGQFEGIDSAWIYLNKNKSGALPKLQALGEVSQSYNDFVSYNLNQVWWDEANDGPTPDNVTLTTSIVIEPQVTTGRDTSITLTPLLNTNWPEEQLKLSIKSNYQTLWDTCVISQQGIGVIDRGTSSFEGIGSGLSPDFDDLTPNDPWLGIIARYALLSTEIPTTIKRVIRGFGRTEEGRIYNTYVVTIELQYTSFSTSSPLVQKIVNDLGGSYSSLTRTYLSYPNGYYTQSSIKAMDSSDLEDDPNLINRIYRLWENEESLNPKYANLWLNYNGTWYLKADVLSNPYAYGLSRKDAYSYLVGLIDSGYKKKKVSWWKKALAVVIFIVAVVFALPSGGASLSITALASAILVGALVLTIFTLAFAAMGMNDMATAFAEVSKAIEPLVMVASIVSLGNNLNQMAAKMATKEAAREYVEEIVKDFIGDLMEGYKDLMAGTLTEASLAFTSKVTSLLTKLAEFRLDSINDRNKDLQAEYEQLTQELARERDLLQGFMRIYSKPATADWSLYSSLFDQPYERGGGPLALGNIQRTTKQAMRKATYDDPAFENTFTV